MNLSIQILIFFTLFVLENVYFKIADKFNIIDKPNHRSSHLNLTIRGGGIIFIVGLLIYPLFYGMQYPFFLLGLTLIGLISFMDDIEPVSNKLRIIIHLLSVALMFYQLGIYTLPVYIVICSFFLVIGSINAINFMDGINGITGSYAMITLCTFLYIDTYIVRFTDPNLIITSLISIVVFNFFNFRKLAKCFAGDVGSVGIAFIILFLLLKLIIQTGNLGYILMLLLYGLDTATTIGFRMLRRERIQDAHRSHFYQFLANEKKIPHLWVAAIYSITQIIVNVSVLFWETNTILSFIISLLSTAVIFIVIRFSMEGSAKLLDH